jgi:hypothetical protein
VNTLHRPTLLEYEMSFSERGFLSSDLDKWREQVRARYLARFALLDQLNELGQRCLNEMCATPHSARDHTAYQLTCALMSRLLQQVQGTIINLERGMVTNARTLLRSGFETCFFLGGSIFIKDFLTTALQDHKYQQDKALRMHMKAIRHDPLSAESIAALEAVRVDLMEKMKEYDAKKIVINDVADKAGLGPAYDGYYRALSTDAAHVNMWSLMEIFDADTGGIKVGPGLGDYEDTLNITVVLAVTMVEVAKYRRQSENIAARLKPLHERANELMPEKPLPDIKNERT